VYRQTYIISIESCKQSVVVILIHDLLFLPISTIESAVGKRLITHCCISRLACSRLSGHIEPHSPRLQREINTTTTVMNNVSNTTVYRNRPATPVYPIVDSGVTITLLTGVINCTLLLIGLRYFELKYLHSNKKTQF